MNKFRVCTSKSAKNLTLASLLFALSGAAFSLSALIGDNRHHFLMAIPALLMFLNSFLYFRLSRRNS